MPSQRHEDASSSDPVPLPRVAMATLTGAGSHRLALTQRIAFVMSPRIGDTLISMVMVQNLVQAGYQVSIFSRHLHALRRWFPHFDIAPALDAARVREVLTPFDVVLHAYAADVVGDVRSWHPCAWVMDEWPTYRQVKPMIDIQLDVCRRDFGLEGLTRHNGMEAPAGTLAHVTPSLVIIHPTASDPHKEWLPQRFVRLARQLHARGYDVQFVVEPRHVQQWRWIEAQGLRLVAHDSLDSLAAWISGAGLFIGNDSGLAHLASNVGVPAISLAMRHRIALRWAPGWAPSEALTPLPLLPGRWAKETL